jgi:hypothetical protein
MAGLSGRSPRRLHPFEKGTQGREAKPHGGRLVPARARQTVQVGAAVGFLNFCPGPAGLF